MTINAASVKTKLWICLMLALSALLLVFSPQSAEAARNGIILCGKAVIPALFPFFVLNGILIRLGFADDIGKALDKPMRRLFGLGGSCAAALITGMVCGYPSGAKAAYDLYKSGSCTKSEAETVLAFANNASPAFLIAGVGTAMLKSAEKGVILYILQLISALAVGIIMKPRRKEENGKHAKRLYGKAERLSDKGFAASQGAGRKAREGAETTGSADISAAKHPASESGRYPVGKHEKRESVGYKNHPDSDEAIADIKAINRVGIKTARRTDSRSEKHSHRKAEKIHGSESTARTGSGHTKRELPSFGLGMLADAIKDSALSVIPVCGSVIFFSVIVHFILRAAFLPDFISCLICGIFEVTSASSAAASMLTAKQSFAAIAFSVGWAGLSVHIQASSVTGGDLDMTKYYAGKALSCGFCSAAAVILIKCGIF